MIWLRGFINESEGYSKMKNTLLPCSEKWFFVGKGSNSEAIIYRIAIWSQTEEGVVTGLIGERVLTDNNPRLIVPPPGCEEAGYFPSEALTTEAIDCSYSGDTLPYKKAFKRFAKLKEVK